MRYFVDNEQVNQREFYEELENAVDAYVRSHPEAFEDWLEDESRTTILGHEFSAAQILKTFDPWAYNDSISDWIDGDISFYRDEIKQDDQRINGKVFRIEDRENMSAEDYLRGSRDITDDWFTEEKED